MIALFITLSATIFLAYSAPLKQTIEDTTPTTIPDQPRIVLVSVCYINSTGSPHCKFSHLVVSKNTKRPVRDLSPYEEQFLVEPNVEDYEQTIEASSTVETDQEPEGSGSGATDGSSEVVTTTTLDVSSTTTPLPTAVLSEEFIKAKLNGFEVNSKELISLLEKLLDEKIREFQATSTLAYTTTTTTSTMTEEDSDKQSLTDEDTIIVDGKKYLVTDLEEAIIDALLEDSPLQE